MTIQAKVLGQLHPAAATPGTLYTVPAGRQAICSSLIIANVSSANTTFRVSIRVGGEAVNNKQYMYFDVTIAGNDTFIATIGVTLAAADVVTVQSASGNLTFQLFGQEVQ